MGSDDKLRERADRLAKWIRREKPVYAPLREVIYFRLCETRTEALAEGREQGIQSTKAPARMDAPGGPVCGCGRPSRAESGWCGVCCEFPPQDSTQQEDEHAGD